MANLRDEADKRRNEEAQLAQQAQEVEQSKLAESSSLGIPIPKNSSGQPPVGEPPRLPATNASTRLKKVSTLPASQAFQTQAENIEARTGPPTTTNSPMEIDKEIAQLEQTKGILLQNNQDLKERYGFPAGPGVTVTYERDTSRKEPRTKEEYLSQLKSDIDILKAERDAYYSQLQRQADRHPFTIHTAPDGKIDLILDDRRALRVDPYIQARDGSWVINPYVIAFLDYRKKLHEATMSSEATKYSADVVSQAKLEQLRQKEAESARDKELSWLRARYKTSLDNYNKAFSGLESGKIDIQTLALYDQDAIESQVKLGQLDPAYRDESLERLLQALREGRAELALDNNKRPVFNQGRLVYNVWPTADRKGQPTQIYRG